jgi:hypothetical protein
MDSHLLAVLPVSTSQLGNLWRKLRWIHGLRALRGEPTTIKIRVDRCRASQTIWSDSNSSMTLVYPSCFPREGIWHLNRYAQRQSVALPFHSIKEHTSFTTKSIDRHASGLRAPGETRATHKEEDCALQYSSRTTKKSWLRTLAVLGDQSRSRTTWQRAWGVPLNKAHPIDQHALGLLAPGRRVL